jgi:hypothetical protein
MRMVSSASRHIVARKRVDRPSPKRSTKISVAFSDLFFKPYIYLGPEVVSIGDATHFPKIFFLAFLCLSGAGRVFIVVILIEIFIVIIILFVEKEVLLLIRKAMLGGR